MKGKNTVIMMMIKVICSPKELLSCGGESYGEKKNIESRSELGVGSTIHTKLYIYNVFNMYGIKP